MKKIPPEVRILPMNLREEFEDYDGWEDVQTSFFLDDLPFRPDGKYRHYRFGLDSDPGTVVLFQCDGRLIASAVLTRKKRFERPDKRGYSGALYFDVKSIRVFDPVTSDEVSKIWHWPEFKHFGQWKWRLNPKRYPAFVRLLTGIKRPHFQ